jgi:putative iron-dependent peroxidase
VIEQMLSNMFIGDPPGNTDRILEFSTALTGGLFFVPTADFLDHPPAPAQAETRAAGDRSPQAGSPQAGAPRDGSLRIGSLRST